MILFIIAGSLVFAQSLAVSGATEGLLESLTALQLSPLAVVVMMMVVLLFLGAFMDQVSMLLLTLPFFLLGATSLQATYDIDPIWLMVLILITMEISLLTPPFGLLLYVMKGVAPFDVSIGAVIRSAMPFILIELLVLILLIFVPEVATWLPQTDRLRFARPARRRPYDSGLVRLLIRRRKIVGITSTTRVIRTI